MAKEIERKYLVIDDSYRRMAIKAIDMEQGYLCRRPTVRVRIMADEARLTVKGPATGISRDEWEYSIPAADARDIIRLSSGVIISKTRYLVPWDGFTWEVDEFHGSHEGLVVAEIELPEAETEFSTPPFVGREVTHDPRFTNAALSQNPNPISE